MVQRFVIIAAPRTGSNLLCTLLQSHPDVLCHHEIFNPAGIFTALPLRKSTFSLGSMTERDADPLSFLARIWENSLDHKQVGFKMTHWQQKQVLDDVCANPDIRKIILKRQAHLKTHVSHLLAERSGVWEDYAQTDLTSKPKPIAVNYKRLKMAVELNDRFYTYIDTVLCGPRSDVLYEDLLNTETQQTLISELGLRKHPLQAHSRRQNPYMPRDLISNSERLAEQLSRNPNDKHLLAELSANPVGMNGG
jgi:hypothetical protein